MEDKLLAIFSNAQGILVCWEERCKTVEDIWGYIREKDRELWKIVC